MQSWRRLAWFLIASYLFEGAASSGQEASEAPASPKASTDGSSNRGDPPANRPDSPNNPPEVPAEYLGYAAELRALDEAARKQLAAADKALASAAATGKWDEATAVLSEVLGTSHRQGKTRAPRIEKGGEAFSTTDGLLFTSVALEVKQRVDKLPPAGLEAWTKWRGDSAEDLEESADSPAKGDGPPERRDLEWAVACGRPDHAAIRLPAEAEVQQGSYARWVHRLKDFRELVSSQPARNFYYAYFPMQVASLGELLFARSHQDIMAFERTTGKVRWHVDSEFPAAEQSHQRTSGFDSYKFFSDLGGWALTAVPGAPDRVIVLNKSGLPTVQSSPPDTKLQFQRNRLRAYDAGSGALSWERGGPEDPDEILRDLTFVAPPTPILDEGAKGPKALVVPATSDDGYFVLGLSVDGKLLWATRLYTYLSGELSWIAASLAHGASLAASGATLVGAPGHGLVFAINARGEVLWEARYPSSVRRIASSPRWAPGHPIIIADKAIVAPFDGDALLAFDLKTGKTLWEKRYSSGYFALIGADAERAYTLQVDGSVTAVSLADGAIAWTSEPLGSPAGRGVVTSKHLIVPVERAILFLDPAKGTVVSKNKIWDETVPQPSPGNLFLVRGEIFLGAPWGFAQIEPYEATWKSLDTLGLREQLLRRSRLLSREGKYVEALEGLRKVLGSASEESERDKLRAEMLEISHEAALNTKDMNFIRRILDQPEIIATRALRTAFLLKSAELLKQEAPGEVAGMYREILEETSSDLVVSPDGVLVDVGVYASDALLAGHFRELVDRFPRSSVPHESPRRDRNATIELL